MQETIAHEGQEELLKYFPRFKNPHTILNCVKHKGNKAEAWKDNMDWMAHEDTICGEWFNGVHVLAEGFAVPENGCAIRTTKSCISPIDQPKVWDAITNSFRDGRYGAASDDYLAGTVFTIEDYAKRKRFYFVARNEQLTKLRFKQWDTGPKTIESAQLWLYEDLQTQLPSKRNVFAGATGHVHKVFSGGEKIPAYNRPDGLLFYNTRYKTFGRMRLQDCTWWQIANNSEFANDKDRWFAINEELDYLKSHVGE